MSIINLFCLPFAGGNKYSYRDFEENAPPGVRITTLEYPGRGSRSREALLRNMNGLVNDAFNKVRAQMRNQPYAFYGHSMGGIVAYLVTKKLVFEAGLVAPLHIFATGSMGPSSYRKESINRHLLPKNEFIEEMRRLDGCPEEILENEEMLSYIEPILRADFETSESFCYEKGSPLDVPMTVITGDQEPFEKEDIAAWQLETSRDVAFYQLPGKHFFILDNTPEIMRIISQKLVTVNKTQIYERR